MCPHICIHTYAQCFDTDNTSKGLHISQAVLRQGAFSASQSFFIPHSSSVMPKPIKQLSKEERIEIDRLLRVEQKTPTEALRSINKARKARKIRELQKQAVYRFVKGRTHKLGAVEKRGRKRSLSSQDIRTLDKTRRRLIQRAKNERRITYQDIIKEAGLEDEVCQRVCEDALRAEGVAYKPPRRKIYVSEEDAKVRKATADKWSKHPKSYWHPTKTQRGVHGYHDEKSFPLPLTEKQRQRFRQTLVTGHLRKPSEGIDRGFTKPREKHSFIGMPSVTISAAVAKDKVIMWHVVEKKWNGASAAAMYTDHLRPALERTWGKRLSYTIVEDGDRKGNASNKGVAAKIRSKIRALTLPPRTPSLMPLDYSIWHTILKGVVKTSPKKGTETRGAFLKRLRGIALSLPKGYVKSVIHRMKDNIQALADARGYTPKND